MSTFLALKLWGMSLGLGKHGNHVTMFRCCTDQKRKGSNAPEREQHVFRCKLLFFSVVVVIVG